MGTPLSALRVAALASVVAWLGAAPAAATPKFVPGTPAGQSGIVLVDDGIGPDSAKIIRRDRLHRYDGGAWKKKRHHFNERRRDHRDHDDDHDFDGRYDLYKPKATQKFAYDEYGNLRVYDGDGWDRDWDGRDWRKRRDWDKWDWDDKEKRKRPRIYKMNSLGHQQPSPGLKGILTTVPD